MTGMIAQEVQKVIPDAIHVGKSGYLELNADPIHWAVVNAIQELYSKLFGKNGEVSSLKAENEELRARISKVEKSNTDLMIRIEKMEQKLKNSSSLQ